jgi:hypothetical protein
METQGFLALLSHPEFPAAREIAELIRLFCRGSKRILISEKIQ